MRTTPADLRTAANIPAYWDIAPLLNDAAKQLEAKSSEPIISEQVVIASVAGAIYGDAVNVATAVQRAREIMREVRRTEPKETPMVPSEVAEPVVGV